MDALKGNMFGSRMGSRMSINRMSNGSRMLGARMAQSYGAAPGKSKLRNVRCSMLLVYFVLPYFHTRYYILVCMLL